MQVEAIAAHVDQIPEGRILWYLLSQCDPGTQDGDGKQPKGPRMGK